MGIWIPRAKPEESKFTYLPTTRCITGLNHDADISALLLIAQLQTALRNHPRGTGEIA